MPSVDITDHALARAVERFGIDSRYELGRLYATGTHLPVASAASSASRGRTPPSGAATSERCSSSSSPSTRTAVTAWRSLR